MAGKQAKVLSEGDLEDLLLYASASRNPIRNRVIVLLSAKAGLRAGEIANLTWEMVLGPTGAVGTAIELRDHAAKKRSGRLIPLHRDLRDALASWRGITRGTGPVALSERGFAMTPLSIVVWFARAYRAVGLEGCSPIRGGEHLSRGPQGSCTKPVGQFAMCSCWLGIGQFRRPSGTSTETAMPNASSCR